MGRDCFYIKSGTKSAKTMDFQTQADWRFGQIIGGIEKSFD